MCVYVHMLSCFSHVQLCVTLQTVACQAPLSMGFSRQEYCSGLLCSLPRDLPNPGIKPMSLTSPALASGFFTTSAPGKFQVYTHVHSKDGRLFCPPYVIQELSRDFQSLYTKFSRNLGFPLSGCLLSVTPSWITSYCSCCVRASHCGGFSCWTEQILRHTGFSSCSAQAHQLWPPESKAQAQQLWCTGLVAPRHMGCSWTRD